MCELSVSACAAQHIESQLLVVWWQAALGYEDLLLPRRCESDIVGMSRDVWLCYPTTLHACIVNHGCRDHTKCRLRPVMATPLVRFRSVADRKRTGVGAAGQRRVGRPAGDGRALMDATEAASTVASVLQQSCIHRCTNRYINRLMLPPCLSAASDCGPFCVQELANNKLYVFRFTHSRT